MPEARGGQVRLLAELVGVLVDLAGHDGLVGVDVGGGQGEPGCLGVGVDEGVEGLDLVEQVAALGEQFIKSHVGMLAQINVGVYVGHVGLNGKVRSHTRDTGTYLPHASCVLFMIALHDFIIAGQDRY